MQPDRVPRRRCRDSLVAQLDGFPQAQLSHAPPTSFKAMSPCLEPARQPRPGSEPPRCRDRWTRRDGSSIRSFKEGAVRIVRETGKPIAQGARELGINAGTLGNWVAQDRQARQDGDAPLGESER